MNTNQNKEEEIIKITYEDLITMNMNRKIVGGMMFFSESCGPIISFLHTPTALHFRLSWLREWEYSE